MRFKGKSSHESYYASDNYGAAYAEPEMMTQKDAMRHFRLSKEELTPLRVKKKLNPVDPCFAPMKLYRIADLQRVCNAKYAQYGGLDAYREQAAEKRRAKEEEKLEKDMGKATRVGELVKLLTDAGVGEKERKQLLALDCAVNFIKRARSKATAFDIATQLLATRSGAAGAAALSEAELAKEMAKATRAGELVKLLTERGLGEKERRQLLAQKRAVEFIKHGKATSFDIANQLMTTRGTAAASTAPVMSTPAKAAPRRAPAATPVKLERDPEVVYLL